MTEDELRALTPEQRARLEAAEQEALRILKRTINDGQRPHRHQQVALAVFFAIAVLGLVFVLIAWLVLR